ncbi:hypothetical protein ACQ4M3_03190 [Leptolyngbya sp. AN03gr2]|uniref:hypothetical protein n=1 Tax=unclassified Leptolyngbya TaxID=2650499 RepID=UPI003D318285
MYRVSEISQAVHKLQNPLSEIEIFKRKYLFYADLDEELADCVAEHLMLYKPALDKIHVQLNGRVLQETFAAYWQNTESAMLSTLEYATRLHARGGDFEDVWHSTNSLADALRTRWMPIRRGYNLSNFNEYCRRCKPTWQQHFATTSKSSSEHDETHI